VTPNATGPEKYISKQKGNGPKRETEVQLISQPAFDRLGLASLGSAIIAVERVS